VNYQHSFHAGNFADVIKHLVYVYTIEYFQKKDTPLFILDTHGGCGLYDLLSEHAQKTQEAHYGVMKLNHLDSRHSLLNRYLSLIQPYLNQNVYPGSPCFAAALLRKQDVLRVSELHPPVYESLKEHTIGFKNIYVTLQDGYESMRAYLPPKEKRGIVLIDPPYEIGNEFTLCAQSLKDAFKRFSQGTYIIWYPIKDHHAVSHFKKSISSLSCEKLELTIELLTPGFKDKLNKAGLLVLNPPYLLQENIQELQSALEQVMAVNIDTRIL